MENIYHLGEQISSINESYEILQSQIDEALEANGGEITEEIEGMQAKIDELEALHEQIANEIIKAPDDYAALVKNTEAQKNILEAELRALKQEQKQIIDKQAARIKRKERKAEWLKQAIAVALKMQGVKKIGGAKTENRFTIWIQNYTSVEADEAKLLNPYQDRLANFLMTLPPWITVTMKVDKTALSKEETLPEGAAIIEKETVRIR